MTEEKDQLAALRKQWEMISAAIPGEEEHENLLSRIPEDRRQEFRDRYQAMVCTREEIAGRITALEKESARIPRGEDASEINWQNLLLKLSLFGWTGPEDFSRMEGRMPRTWPATTVHSSVRDWLPFAEWCRRHWIYRGRVSCLLALDAGPELLASISPPLKIAAVSSSMHEHNLSGFLKLFGPNATDDGSSLHPVMGETGHAAVMSLPHGNVQAVLIGSRAWEKWHALPPAMLSWMLGELAERAVYLAVETASEGAVPEETGWIPQADGPDHGNWRVWRARSFAVNGGKFPFHDIRTRVNRIRGGPPVIRTAFLGGGSLTVHHQSPDSLELETEAWRLLQGLHPMIPQIEDSDRYVLRLRIPVGKNRWMPVGRIASTDESVGKNLARLFYLLWQRNLLPQDLGVGDFLATGDGPLLTRIGFSNCFVHADPLDELVRTLSSWHLTEPPPEIIQGKPRSFPAPFRDLASTCLSALSLRDLNSRLGG